MELVGAHDLHEMSSTSFIIEPVREYSVVALSPANDAVTHEPDFLVQVAVSANRSDPFGLTINEVAARVRSYDEHPWVYIARVPLQPGGNELNIRATFEDGESRLVQQQIRYDVKPKK